jgi:hypothetical protein
MFDSPVIKNDKATVPTETDNKLSASAEATTGLLTNNIKTATADHVAAGTLPALAIDGANSSDTHWYSGAMAVTKDLAKGAYDEVTQHPLHLIESAAAGAAIGTVATLAAPEVGAALLIGGGAYLAYETYEHAGGVLHDAHVVSNPQAYSAADAAKAHSDLQNAGAVGINVAAGIAGGFAGSYAAGAYAAADSSAAGAGSGDSQAAAPKFTTGNVSAASDDGAPDSVLTNGKIILKNVSEAKYTHAEVNAGQLTSPDGTVQDVYFHGNEATPGATAVRLGNEQAGFSLNRIIGFDNSYPESQAVNIDDGEILPAQGWLQQSAGNSLESELRTRAMQQFGSTSGMDQDVTKILANDPALHAKVQQAVVERLVYGDNDIAAANIGVAGQGSDAAVSNFDLGHAFGDNTIPTLDSYQGSLTTVGLQNAVSGRPLSPEISEILNNFLTKYDTPTGLADLRQTGLSDSQIQGVIGRTNWLVKNGSFPEADPSINDPNSISMYRAVERSTSEN